MMSSGTIFILHGQADDWPEKFLVKPGDRVLLSGLPVGAIDKIENERVYVRWNEGVELGSYMVKGTPHGST